MPKVEPIQEAKPAPIAKKTIASQNSDIFWDEINFWIERCKKAKENFSYMTVQYSADVHLDGSKDEWANTSTTFERPFRDKEDSYGGYWGGGSSYSTADLYKLKKVLLEWTSNLLSFPYRKQNSDGHLIRDMKRENIRIFIDPQSKEFINKSAGWTIEQFSKELASLPEAVLTEEYLQKVSRMKFLDKEINRIEYHVIPKLKEKVEELFDGSTQNTLTDADFKEIPKIIQENRCSLSVMRTEYDALREELYRW